MENNIEIKHTTLTFQPKTVEWCELEDILMDALDTAHHGEEPLVDECDGDYSPDTIAIATVTVNALKDAGLLVEG